MPQIADALRGLFLELWTDASTRKGEHAYEKRTWLALEACLEAPSPTQGWAREANGLVDRLELVHPSSGAAIEAKWAALREWIDRRASQDV